MNRAERRVPDPSPLEAGLRRTHRSVLFLLASCAVAIVLHGFAGDEPAPNRWLTTAGVGLGLGTVVTRRLGGSPVMALRSRFFFLLAALVFSAVLGLLGAWIAWATDGPETGLLFTVAGAIFAIRPARLTVGAA
jgi:hypothetical protein